MNVLGVLAGVVLGELFFEWLASSWSLNTLAALLLGSAWAYYFFGPNASRAHGSGDKAPTEMNSPGKPGIRRQRSKSLPTVSQPISSAFYSRSPSSSSATSSGTGGKQGTMFVQFGPKAKRARSFIAVLTEQQLALYDSENTSENHVEAPQYVVPLGGCIVRNASRTDPVNRPTMTLVLLHPVRAIHGKYVHAYLTLESPVDFDAWGTVFRHVCTPYEQLYTSAEVISVLRSSLTDETVRAKK